MSQKQGLNNVRELNTMISNRCSALKEVIEQKEKDLAKNYEKLPSGSIRICLGGKNHTSEQYFWRAHPSDRTGKYIKKDEFDEKIIKDLIQREYDTKILEAAQKEYTSLRHRDKKDAGKDPLIAVYESMGTLKQKWITPVVASDEEYVKIWKARVYTSQSYKNEKKIFDTKQGEKVRSKSELLIANALYDHNIPYRYEYPLTEQNKVWALPDFIILQVRQRKEYFWEHFGMMGDSEYSRQALNKIKKYEQHYMFAGENIIYTFESADVPLDTRSIETLIRHYFLQ